MGFLSIIILSIIFSWTFIKSKNIWISILLHMYWDLLMFMFY
ncbi:MAG: CPBP family intramembrane metalloprotease [Lachnospiraceae bacterium]|nr:CPBP family intramembrane metalloprotease [Lachnospiraceae bacterium]